MFSRSFKIKNLAIIFPILLAAGVLLIGINKPFIGQHDFMGAMEGTIAKNYLYFGPLNLKFAQIDGRILDVAHLSSYHLSYPPLLPLLIYLSIKIFGVSEWAIRLVPVVFSLISVGFFFKIIQKLWSLKIALLASVFFILNPMFIYYGKLPTVEPPVIACSIAAFYFYLIWLEKKSFKSLFWILFWILTGGLISWQILYICGVILIHSLILGEFSLILLLPGALGGFTIALLLIHSFILTGSFLTPDIINTIKFRLTDSDVNFGGLDFNLGSYLRQEVSWIQAYFTRTLLVLSSVYLFASARKKLDVKKTTVLIFLLFGLIHLIIFSRYVFIHDYMNFFLLPFLALSAALGTKLCIDWLTKFNIDKRVIYGGIFLILFLFVTERLKFSQALFNTSMNEPGLQVAQLLNNLQSDNFEVAVDSFRFNDFYGVFTNYYSKYAYATTTDQQLKQQDSFKNYKYIIMFDEDITDKDFYNQLITKYPYQRQGEMIVIHINEK